MKDANDIQDIDDEEEFEWEEIPAVEGCDMEQNSDESDTHETRTETREENEGETFEIEIQDDGNKYDVTTTTAKTSGKSKAQRQIRITQHRAHLLCLVAAARIRAKWIMCQEIYAIALSFVTQTSSVSTDTPSILQCLYSRFVENYSPENVDQTAAWSCDLLVANAASPSLPPNQRAIIFTALCHAANLRSRLVASLHPTPLSFAKKALNPRYNKVVFDDANDSIFSPDDSALPTNPQETDAIRLWTQVADSVTNEWINVCPNRGVVPYEVFEPAVTASDQEQLVYVIALSVENGNDDENFLPPFRDVTKSFSTRWASRIAKLRPKDENEENSEIVSGWWQMVVWLGSASIPSNFDFSSDALGKMAADIKEDLKIKKSLENEVMPSRFDGFKGNAIYALERHLTQSEVIYPTGQKYVIGNFKGEPVYPRSHVKDVLSAVTWRKQGRKISEGESPAKQVKARGTGNIKKKREIEIDRINNDSEVSEMTDLFGEWQTEAIMPEDLKNGKIPKNRFGNFEIFHSNMKPSWGVHVRTPGAAAVAKKLGIDYAPVMIGFEHHGGRATPTLDGIIIRKEDREILTDAVTADTEYFNSKANQKKSRQAILNWKKLVEKAVVMSNLKEKYL
ncbi:hypothetical protein HK100_006404 [Physocladia obscura]|uniref:Rad4-domain-containing protein n=1 Tax=Physocladia obscura TaxID=109957 RepID=A0AAD5SQI2_9FUNG|nr:hypothetical protein HK100_006404 [Physocladia obscura]